MVIKISRTCFSPAFMMFACVITVAFPIFVFFGMFLKFKDLEAESTMNRFGSLYSNFDLRHGRVLALIPTTYLLRRVVLAVVVT